MQFPILVAALAPLALAMPAPAPAAVDDAAHPMITLRATLVDRTPSRVIQRGLISDLTQATGFVASLVSGLGSAIPSYVVSGVPNFFQDFPTGDAVLSKLDLQSSDLAASPTMALNLPGYANWTNDGWSVRVHGNIYKKPNLTESKLNDLANGFLIGTQITDLPAAQQTQARNLTAEIYVVQQKDVNVTVTFVDNFKVPNIGINGGLVAAKGGAQQIQLPDPTTDEGDFDSFVSLKNSTGTGGSLLQGNLTTSIQALNYYVNGSDIGNATAYLVPTHGITIVSDIDDILRITKIYEPAQGLLNSFAKAFVPWMNMPDIYANFSRSLPDFHFHYLTTTPEQITPNYMDFIYSTYPLGSFDTRPLNFSDVSATLAIRKFLLQKVFETYPTRKFILIADTSNADVMKDYPEMATDFPGQVLCIWLRNTSSTDSGDKFPYDTSGFKNLDNSTYMFFNVPDDLTGLDVINGQCRNNSVLQNVTFSEQGLPFGLGAARGMKADRGTLGMVGLAMVLSALFSFL